ncbi:MAG: hypothetical protein KDK37_02010, partial [Leptospiraceae bacterium]|nr:hypothetical protein [Leptospiraceae bacterium]
MNYPWRIYGGDFGGIPAWSKTGIAAHPGIYDRDLRAIRDTGSRVVRWWMFPDLRTGGIQIENGRLKAGKTLFADLREALRLAKKNDLKLVLCLFSFESFRPARKEGALKIRNLEDVLRDPRLRRDLMEEVIAPLARTAAQSPDSDALYAWDLINEPEWSLKGVDPVGGHPFYPLESVRPVSHAFMQEFLAQLAQTIRKEGATRITVGQSTPRWPQTWKALDLDFYQWHLYD